MSKATIFEFSRQKSQRKSLENKRWDFIFDFQTLSSVEKLESEKLFSYRKSFISIFQMSLRFPRGLLFPCLTFCLSRQPYFIRIQLSAPYFSSRFPTAWQQSSSRRIDTKAKEAKQLHATLDRQNPWGMSADLSTSNLEKKIRRSRCLLCEVFST